MSTAKLFAHQLRPGLTVEIHPREWVTVQAVTDQGRWVTNAMVYIDATNGRRYGLFRYDRVVVEVRSA
ncbi:hypothetical protein [Streptomyces sp. AC495_CC817]|uniref:hypothetical protein n=1 Tax=Streptomyces sp. AC495_CC817 TaxID=2823900 RepID=UPI001C258600|nr:hypothetical protein [Streptomyces sp. AC495_CC817]